jgi:hypothetical protein
MIYIVISYTDSLEKMYEKLNVPGSKIMPERWQHMFCASCFLFGEQEQFFQNPLPFMLALSCTLFVLVGCLPVCVAGLCMGLRSANIALFLFFFPHLLIRKRVKNWCNFSKFVARHVKFSWHINQLIAVENYLIVPKRQNKTKSVKFHLNCMHLFKRFLYKLVR